MMKFKGSIVFNDKHTDEYKSLFGDDKKKYTNANIRIQIKERSKKDLPEHKKEFSLTLKINDINISGDYKNWTEPWMYKNNIAFTFNIQKPIKLGKPLVIIRPQKTEDRNKLLDFLKNHGKMSGGTIKKTKKRQSKSKRLKKKTYKKKK